MFMGIYSDKAVDNFKQGYNCAQSVLLAFVDLLDIEPEFALKLTSSFGAGMGRLREVCGACSAMFMIAGLLNGYIEPNNDELKAKHYSLIQDLANEFKSRYNTIICRELLGLGDGPDSPIPSPRDEKYYRERPCEHFIRAAAEIIEAKLLNNRSKGLVVHVNSGKN